MDNLNTPPALNFNSIDKASSWKKWLKQFKIYYQATELKKKENETQIAVFLNIAGPDASEVFDTLNLTPNSIDDALEAFNEHFEPQQNQVFERYKFWSRDLQEDESLIDWITDLKIKAASCNFDTQTDALIRDKIVFGVKDHQLKERLLREPKLTLEDAVQICRAVETSRFQVKTMSEEREQSEIYPVRLNSTSGRRMATREREDLIQNCRYCGNTHPVRRCPAYGKSCSKCGKVNNFAKV